MGDSGARTRNGALRQRLAKAMNELYASKPPKGYEPTDARLAQFVEALEVNLETARFFRSRVKKTPTDPAGPRLHTTQGLVSTTQLAKELRKQLRPMKAVKGKTSVA